jgi:ABC-type bacteriocin/lantibiotic exporter with double-glycine peptidase domain
VPSLSDISLTIAPRAYVAIVGASGSGKSTLLRLLLGLETPSQGAVYFDDLDARHLDAAQLRRQIGYVGQDSRLSPGSILDNILDGRPAAAPEAWEAARLAGLVEEIDAMPMGMQTLVGEGGQNISGGQRQRILIARAVMARPRILIFDEATSALDNRVQALVQRGLAELPTTRIVVAHRLSTIGDVDRMYVLAKGRLVEAGSPAELLAQGGVFAALAGRQRVDAADPPVHGGP